MKSKNHEKDKAMMQHRQKQCNKNNNNNSNNHSDTYVDDKTNPHAAIVTAITKNDMQ